MIQDPSSKFNDSFLPQKTKEVPSLADLAAALHQLPQRHLRGAQRRQLGVAAEPQDQRTPGVLRKSLVSAASFLVEKMGGSLDVFGTENGGDVVRPYIYIDWVLDGFRWFDDEVYEVYDRMMICQYVNMLPCGNWAPWQAGFATKNDAIPLVKHRRTPEFQMPIWFTQQPPIL